MVKLLVAIAVGLRPKDLAYAPALRALGDEGFVSPLETIFPALTCPVQATFLTGALPREHGVVANGWYHRQTAEVRFWLQSNHLVEGEKFYEQAAARDPEFVCAKLFWWFNMYSAAAISMTPRPEYHSDGLKLPGLYSDPPELKDDLQKSLGAFPLFKFWGPGAGIASTDWIARSARRVIEQQDPTLTLVYLPHLDYDHQRFGPDDHRSQRAVGELDAVVAPLFETARETGREILVLGEYGIEAVDRPVFLNRVLRTSGRLRVQETGHGELLDAGRSDAFAVCDHQVAHVYVSRAADVPRVAKELERVEGVERVLHREEQKEFGIDHPRAGELICIAEPTAWFAYPYWLDEARRPDFATSVDIHRKPGFDPSELFLDPKLRAPKARIATRLLRKKLGFRYRMDVISTDPSMVRGSHGRLPARPELGPVALGSFRRETDAPLRALDVSDLILSRLAYRSGR